MTYIVSTMDGEKLTVPQQVGEAILEAKSPFVRFGQRMINLKSVAKIVPETETTNYPSLPEPKAIRVNSQRAIESLIRGLKKFMAENPYTEKSEKLLERMEKQKVGFNLGSLMK